MSRIAPTLAAVVLALAGLVWFNAQSANTALVTPALAQDSTADVELVPDHVLGDANAPVTVIEYASYTCPHCAHFHEDQFKQLKAKYIDTGKVKFIHREVYFDRYGLWGGLLASCGGDIRYFGIAGQLYDTQKTWIGSGDPAEIIANLTTLGKSAGLSEDEITACLNDKDMATRLVATYQKHAGDDGVNATPTLFVNGVKYSNMSFDKLASIIDAQLGDG